VPIRSVLGPFFRVEENGEIRIVGKRDAVIPQEYKRGFICGPADRNGENFASTCCYCCSILLCEGGDFLLIEFSIHDGKHIGILTSFLYGNRNASKVAFIVESCFFDKLRVILVGLRFRRPRIKSRNKRRAPKLAKIHKKNCLRVGGHKHQRFFARRAGVRGGPFSNCEKCNRTQENENYCQSDLCPFGHGLRTIHDGVAISAIVPLAWGLAASKSEMENRFWTMIPVPVEFGLLRRAGFYAKV